MLNYLLYSLKALQNLLLDVEVQMLFYPNLNFFFHSPDANAGEILIILPNLITYDVMKAVTIVTMPNIGKTDELIAPTSWPALATTKDSSPLAEVIPSPVRNAVILS
jgi:hypothetical protein